MQRQFIELYNTPDKHRKDNAALNKSDGIATNGSRSVTRQTTSAGRIHDAGRTTATSGFGSGPSVSGPVTGKRCTNLSMMLLNVPPECLNVL